MLYSRKQFFLTQDYDSVHINYSKFILYNNYLNKRGSKSS